MPAKSNRDYNCIKGTEKINIKRGYLNYLLRKQKILLNTDANQKKYEDNIRLKREQEAQKLIEIKTHYNALNNKALSIEMETNDDKLYSSINEKTIAKLIKEQHDITVNPKQIILEQNIENLGEYPIKIKFTEAMISKMNISVAKKNNI
ncbi:MAG: 50S ribosomal L9 C-terminal domain-containing protein [Pseudomonadota bacterium]